MAAVGGGRLDRSGTDGAADASRYRGAGQHRHGKATQGHLAAVVDGAERGPRSEKLGELSLSTGCKGSIQTACFASTASAGRRNRIALCGTFERPALRKEVDQAALNLSTSLNHGEPLREYELCWLATATTASSRTTTYTSSMTAPKVSYNPLKNCRCAPAESLNMHASALRITVFSSPRRHNQPGDTVDHNRGHDRDRDYFGGAGYCPSPARRLRAGSRVYVNQWRLARRQDPVWPDHFTIRSGAGASRLPSDKPRIVAKLVSGRSFPDAVGDASCFPKLDLANRNNIIGAYEFNSTRPLLPQHIYNIELSLSAVIFKHWRSKRRCCLISRSSTKSSLCPSVGTLSPKPQSAERHRFRAVVAGAVWALYRLRLAERGVQRRCIWAAAVSNPLPAFLSLQGILGIDLDVAQPKLHLMPRRVWSGRRVRHRAIRCSTTTSPTRCPRMALMSRCLMQALHPVWSDGGHPAALDCATWRQSTWAEPGHAGFDLPAWDKSASGPQAEFYEGMKNGRKTILLVDDAR